MGGEFSEKNNLLAVRGKNWQEKSERYFRMQLLHSKLILCKEGLLIFIKRVSRFLSFCLF